MRLYKVLSGVLTVFISVMSVVATQYGICPDGTFLPTDGTECRPCSGCSNNEVVRETCSGTRDTLCGPFKEFQVFKSYHVENEPTSKSNGHADGGRDSDPLHGVSVAMAVLLAVTSIICVTVGALVCYKRLKDKKEGLMIQADKDSEQPICSDWLENNGCRRRPPSVSTGNDVMDAPTTSSTNIQQFEISENDPDT